MATLSLKEELQTWADALQAYDKEDYEGAIDKFTIIAESSRIFFNVGIIHATIGQHEQAISFFRQACDLDVYLAIAFFQCGVSLFLLGQYREALVEFDTAYALMRTNMTIDYDQIGLKFRLYSCEILFNCGLCHIYLENFNEGMRLLGQARAEKQIDEHAVIDEAFTEQAAGFTVFSIPVGVLYRPAEAKLRNLKAKDWLGKARLVAATSTQDAHIGFAGAARAKARYEEYATSRKGSTASETRVEMEKAAARVVQEPFDLAFSKPKRVPTQTSPQSAPLAKSNTVASTAARRISPHLRQNSTPLSIGSIKGRSQPFATDIRPLGIQRSRTVLPVNPPVAPPTPPQSQGDNDEVLQYYDGPAESIIFETPARQRDLVRQPTGQNPARVADWARRNAKDSPTNSIYPATVRDTLYNGLRKSASTSFGQEAISRSNSQAPSQQVYSTNEPVSITRLRLKLHCDDSIRAISVTPDIPISDLVDLVSSKLSKDKLKMRFKDEEGLMIDLIDDSDWQNGIETAQDSAKGKMEGKLDIWVS